MTESTKEQQAAYAQSLRKQFQESPEFRTPAEFAAKFHDALVGWGQPLAQEQQEARFHRLSDLRELEALTAAAGEELAAHYMRLDALSVRLAGHVARIDPNKVGDPTRLIVLVEATLKASKAARACLGASILLAEDLKLMKPVRVEAVEG